MSAVFLIFYKTCFSRLLLFGTLLAVFCNICTAKVYITNPTLAANDAFYTQIKSLLPGDIYYFDAGTYTMTSKLSFTVTGTAQAPITIAALPGKHVVLTRDTSQNIWDINGSWFVLANLTFTGGSQGLRFGELSATSNVLVENVVVNNVQACAVVCNSGHNCFNMVFRHVEIYNTCFGASVADGCTAGDCFYFGHQDNGNTAYNNIFEYIYCHDTGNAVAGYGHGVQIKTGSYNNVVRNSVFQNIAGPCVLVYDDWDLGVNIIDGNLCINSLDVGIQFTAGVVVTNNIVYNSAYSGIGCIGNQQKMGQVARNIRIVHNSVFDSIGDACIHGWSFGPTSVNIVIANNALFCSTGMLSVAGASINSITMHNNSYTAGPLPGGVSDPYACFPVVSAISELLDFPNSNVYPHANSKLVTPGGRSNLGSLAISSDHDFNCRPRSIVNPTIGAYEYIGVSNTGWAFSFTTERGYYIIHFFICKNVGVCCPSKLTQPAFKPFCASSAVYPTAAAPTRASAAVYNVVGFMSSGMMCIMVIMLNLL